MADQYSAVILPIHRSIQQTPYSCGPASLKAVLAVLGKKTTERQLMKLAKTTPKYGTFPHDLVGALSRLGIKHTVFPQGSMARLESELRAMRLCIVDYRAWTDGHYSVIFGYSPTHLYIADPHKKKATRRDAIGFRTIHKNLFEKRWWDDFPNGLRTHHWMVSIPIV